MSKDDCALAKTFIANIDGEKDDGSQLRHIAEGYWLFNGK